MAYVDFAALKQSVAIETIVPMLGLDMKQAGEQLRGPCPACRSGGKRALVVTPAKSAFYCFGGHTGGDVISLAAHIRQCSMKDAAAFLAGDSGAADAASPSRSGSTVPEERPKGDARILQPLAYLEPDHAAVAALGLSAETCAAFGAGYAPKGIMRGRLAIPVRDLGGNLIAYCGQALKDETTSLIFPKGFSPAEHVFNGHRAGELMQGGEGELILARDPLEVMIAAQNGIANAVSFFTETIAAKQLQRLSTLMVSINCDSLAIA
jgi:DNA primase